MIGPEHYREAEKLVDNAVRHTTEHPGDMRIAEVCAATAQVHATLALAAATAAAGDLIQVHDDPTGERDLVFAWTEVAT